MKSPEQYFEEQQVWSPGAGKSEKQYTPTEQAFLKKYMGVDVEKKDQPDLGQAVNPATVPGFEGPDVSTDAHPKKQISVAESLRQESETQFVSFYLSKQEFALPISYVQEVITYIEPTKLPAAPDFIAGVANLRGRVTPLIKLEDLLRSGQGEEEPRFIIVCRYDELQIGLIIHSVATMYRVTQDQMDWSIDNNLGGSGEAICGLIKIKEQLIGIVAIDKIINTILD